MPGASTSGASKAFVLFGDLKFWAFGDRRQLTLEA
jgi:hypothetical protein